MKKLNFLKAKPQSRLNLEKHVVQNRLLNTVPKFIS